MLRDPAWSRPLMSFIGDWLKSPARWFPRFRVPYLWVWNREPLGTTTDTWPVGRLVLVG